MWSKVRGILMNCQRAKVSRLLISRQRNLGRTLVSQIGHNVCVCAVVRFRSRVLSPTLNVERRYKLWATPHRTIEETFCWQQLGLGSVVLYVFSVHWFEVYVLSSVNEAQLHNFLSRSRSFILSRPFCIWVRSSICQRTRIESQCWNYPTALH